MIRKQTERTKDFKRVSEVIQADKSVMSEACKTLVLQDLAEKLDEYFDVIGLPQLDMHFQNGTYYVSVNFQAERIKKFHVLK